MRGTDCASGYGSGSDTPCEDVDARVDVTGCVKLEGNFGWRDIFAAAKCAPLTAAVDDGGEPENKGKSG